VNEYAEVYILFIAHYPYQTYISGQVESVLEDFEKKTATIEDRDVVCTHVHSLATALISSAGGGTTTLSWGRQGPYHPC
jgi:hypothetical protein